MSEYQKGHDEGYAWAKIHWNGKTMKLPDGFQLIGGGAYWRGFDEGARCWRFEN